MGNRFGHAPEHQHGTDAAGKQHGEPGNITVGRFRVVAAQPDGAESAERNPQEERYPTRHPENEKPTQVGNNPFTPRSEGLSDWAGRNQEHDQKQDHDPSGREKDGRVGPETQLFCESFHDDSSPSLSDNIGANRTARQIVGEISCF